jgi:hypothetical protein
MADIGHFVCNDQVILRIAISLVAKPERTCFGVSRLVVAVYLADLEFKENKMSRPKGLTHAFALTLTFIPWLANGQMDEAAVRARMFFSEAEFQRVTEANPSTLVQVVLDWDDDATLQQASELVRTFSIQTLAVVASKNASARSGMLAPLIYFVYAGPPVEQQLERARCALLLPNGEFTNMGDEVGPEQIGQWRLSSGSAYMTAIDARLFLQSLPTFISRADVMRESFDPAKIIEVARWSLSRIDTALNAEVPTQCTKYFKASKSSAR